MFRTLSLADALAVCSDMRARDWQCVRAICGDLSAEDFAANRWQTDGPAWTFLQDGKPAAIGGLSFSTGWSAVFWVVATPSHTRQSWRNLLRHARTVLANVCNPDHPHYRHRVEVHTLVGWKEADAFAERLGLRLEGRRFAVGCGGEDVNVWVRIGAPKEKAWRPDL